MLDSGYVSKRIDDFRSHVATRFARMEGLYTKKLPRLERRLAGGDAYPYMK
jgi:hypothetical protein